MGSVQVENGSRSENMERFFALWRLTIAEDTIGKLCHRIFVTHVVPRLGLRAISFDFPLAIPF